MDASLSVFFPPPPHFQARRRAFWKSLPQGFLLKACVSQGRGSCLERLLAHWRAPSRKRRENSLFEEEERLLGASQGNWVSSEEVSRPNNATDTDKHPTGTSQLK